MKVVCYTNCQGGALIHFVKKVMPEFEQIQVLTFEHIWNKLEIPFHIFRSADILLYQPIDKKHGIYSTDSSVEGNVLSLVPEGCVKISFPYIYFSAAWPLISPHWGDCVVETHLPNSHQYVNREPIEKLKKEGHSLDDVIDLYRKGQIDFEYERRYKYTIGVLREKESICDIKVCDFIEENLKSHKLFLTQNHPTSCVFAHCANQFLTLLGYKGDLDPFVFPENDANLPVRWPTTSYDKKYWGFEYETDIDDEFYVGHIANIYNAAVV